MKNMITQEEMGILLGDRDLAAGAHLLNVAGAWPSIKVLSSMLKGGAKQASQISEETNLDMQDVLDTLKDLEVVNLVRCKFYNKDRTNYWTLANSRFTMSLSGDNSGIHIDYSAESEPKGFLAGLRSAIRKSRNR